MVFSCSISTPKYCDVSTLLGQTITAIGRKDTCYQLELFEGGALTLDTNNRRCENDSFREETEISLFNATGSTGRFI